MAGEEEVGVRCLGFPGLWRVAWLAERSGTMGKLGGGGERSGGKGGHGGCLIPK